MITSLGAKTEVLIEALPYISRYEGKTFVVKYGGAAVIALFQLVTLPVEFDASARAKVQLVNLGIVDADEMPGVHETLDAAALTYVAALIAAALQPTCFNHLTLYNILGTLKSLFDWAEKYEQRQSLFCFGLLEVCDLPDLLPLLEGVELTTDR